MNDEPVQACPPSAGYRLRKFVRRNKAAVAAGAVVALSVLVAVVGLVISNVRIDREKTQKEAALAEAEANLLLARQAVDEIYEPVAEQLAMLPHMQAYQRDVLEKTLRFYQEFAQRKSTDPAIRLDAADAALRVLGTKWMLGQRESFEERSREIIVALEQLAEEIPSEPKRRLVLAGAHRFLAGILSRSGRREEAEKHCRQAVSMSGELAAERPDLPERRRQLAGAQNSLGECLQDRPEKAEECHREAIRLCEALVAERSGEPIYEGARAHSYYVLGYALAEAKRRSEAEEAYRQAIAICEEAGEPLTRTPYRFICPQAQYHLGQVLQGQRRTEAAEAAYRRAVASAERVASQYPDILYYRRNLAVYSLVLASLLGRTDRPDQAAPFTRLALELSEKLRAEIPEETQPSKRVIDELNVWGRSLRVADALKEADPILRKALELAKKLATESPTEVGCQYQLAVCHWELGVALQRARRFREAAHEYREELAIYEKLAAAFPAEPEYRHLQTRSANFLGIALRHTKETEAAARHHREAIRICDQLVPQFLDRPRYRAQLVRGHYALGLALLGSGRWAEVEASFRQALTESAPLPDEFGNPQHPQPQPAPVHEEPIVPSIKNDLAWLLATCPETKLRDPARAVTLARQAVEGDPRPPYWNTLGVAEFRAGHCKEALAALQKSMDLRRGGDGFDWFFLAMAHWQLGAKDEARKWYDKAARWMDKNAKDNEELRRFRTEAEELLKKNAAMKPN